MLFSHSILTAALAGVATAWPFSASHSVHEKRSEPSSGWVKRDVLYRRAILPMKVGLAQSNLDRAWEWLEEVSHPTSEKYGKHWSAKQVAEAFRPSHESVEAVKAWLTSSGISADRIGHSQSLSWLEFDATVDEAEDLLKTTYHAYEHDESGQPHVACDQYSIPSHLQQHIDIVSPTVHFDAKIKPRNPSEDLEKRADVKGIGKGVGKPGGGSLPKGGWRIGEHKHKKLQQDLTYCDTYITPDCLRALYGFPVNNKANAKNSYGIVEYTPQSYLPSDLDLFFANFSTSQIGNRPTLDSIDGGALQNTSQSFDFNGEADLDLQYAMSLVYPQQVTLYQAGDPVEGASFNNFLDGESSPTKENPTPTMTC